MPSPSPFCRALRHRHLEHEKHSSQLRQSPFPSIFILIYLADGMQFAFVFLSSAGITLRLLLYDFSVYDHSFPTHHFLSPAS
jgi:hypothetical protein